MLEFTAQEASRRGNWMVPSLSNNKRVIKGGDTGWRLFQGVLWKGPLWKRVVCGKTYVFLGHYQLLSTLVLCLVWYELTGDGHQAENRKGKLLQWPLNSYYDTLILFLAAFVLACCVFSDGDERGWVDGKERSPSFRRAFFEAKLLMYAFLTSCAICFSKSASANWLSIAYYWFKPITSDFCLGKNEILHVFLPKASWVEKTSDHHKAH